MFSVISAVNSTARTTDPQLEYKTLLAGPTQRTNQAESIRYIGGSGASISISRKRTDQNIPACFCLLCLLALFKPQPTDSQNEQKIIKHTTRENYHLTKANHKRLTHPTNTAAEASCSGSLHKEKKTHTDGSQKWSVRFLTQARHHIFYSSSWEQSTPSMTLSSPKSAVRQTRARIPAAAALANSL